MRQLTAAPLLLALATLVALPAHAGIVWRGDFETGTVSQWSRAQRVSADRLEIVTSPVRDGRYALRATVKQGDDPINASGNRNELLYITHEPRGSEYFYKFSVLFDPTFPSANTWQVFTQWHHEGCCGSPPLEMYVVGEKMHLRAGGASAKVLWTAPLVRGKWQDFVLRVKWSSDPKVGFVELYHQGQKALAKTPAVTMYDDSLNYLKLGLYRNDTIAPEGTVFHDGMTMATALEDVLEPTTVAAPTPAVNPTTTPTGTPEQPATPPVAGEPSTPTPTPASEEPGTEPATASNDPMLADTAVGCSAGGSATTGVAALLGALMLAAALRRRPRQAAVTVRSSRTRR